MERLSSADWSKQEKEIAHKAYRAAYNREAMAIAHTVRKMAAGINEPSDLWKICEVASIESASSLSTPISARTSDSFLLEGQYRNIFMETESKVD